MRAMFIVIIVAGLTQRRAVCAVVFIAGNSLAAAGTENSLLVQAGGAEQFIPEWDQSLGGKGFAAMSAGLSLFGIHIKSP